MSNTIEIKLAQRGFEVTAAGRTTRFPTVEEVLDFAQQRLQLAEEIRQLSMRCE